MFHRNDSGIYYGNIYFYFNVGFYAIDSKLTWVYFLRPARVVYGINIISDD